MALKPSNEVSSHDAERIPHEASSPEGASGVVRGGPSRKTNRSVAAARKNIYLLKIEQTKIVYVPSYFFHEKAACMSSYHQEYVILEKFSGCKNMAVLSRYGKNPDVWHRRLRFPPARNRRRTTIPFRCLSCRRLPRCHMFVMTLAEDRARSGLESGVGRVISAVSSALRSSACHRTSISMSFLERVGGYRVHMF